MVILLNIKTKAFQCYFCYLFCFAAVLAPSTAYSATRDQIRIVGSGTVFPFSALAAETFGKIGKFKTPIVEATGTGGGFKLFCSGTGLETPDIANASRPMLPEERTQCENNGVTTISEFTIGYDGIVLARKKQASALSISAKNLFMALARQVPENGKLVNNISKNWKEINPLLPNQAIKVYGTSPASGTRDTFVEIIMQNTCKNMSEFKAIYPDPKDLKNACGLIREDGKFIEAGEDYNATAQKLSNDATAFAIFGYSFLEPNKAVIQSLQLNGVEPNDNTIANGSYALSRKLYFYIKEQHIKEIPGIISYAREITSDAAIGPEGYLTEKGLIPLNDDERKSQHQVLKTLAEKN